MVRNELPRSVQKLIAQHFQSAAEVETLLLLFRDPRGWDASGVARELRFDPDHAAAILARLSRRGLLREEGRSYCFDPRDPEEAQAVAKLAELYPTYRVAVVSMIYGRPTGPIRDFSDAFRVRRDD